MQLHLRSQMRPFDHYLEKDASGKATGYVVIHYMGGSDYKNQADYDAAMATP